MKIIWLVAFSLSLTFVLLTELGDEPTIDEFPVEAGVSLRTSYYLQAVPGWTTMYSVRRESELLWFTNGKTLSICCGLPNLALAS